MSVIAIGAVVAVIAVAAIAAVPAVSSVAAVVAVSAVAALTYDGPALAGQCADLIQYAAGKLCAAVPEGIDRIVQVLRIDIRDMGGVSMIM